MQQSKHIHIDSEENCFSLKYSAFSKVEIAHMRKRLIEDEWDYFQDNMESIFRNGWVPITKLSNTEIVDRYYDTFIGIIYDELIDIFQRINDFRVNYTYRIEKLIVIIDANGHLEVFSILDIELLIEKLKISENGHKLKEKLESELELAYNIIGPNIRIKISGNNILINNLPLLLKERLQILIGKFVSELESNIGGQYIIRTIIGNTVSIEFTNSLEEEQSNG